ncbi:hypothetical protein L7F22_063678 [Adiantum nelumboides]|nr:hypothetical protein [Adiantum nelumboides]
MRAILQREIGALPQRIGFWKAYSSRVMSQTQEVESVTSDAYEPLSVDVIPNNVIRVAAGHYHSLAVTADGQLWSWGRKNESQVGRGTALSRDQCDHPQIVKGLESVEVKDAAGSGVVSMAIEAPFPRPVQALSGHQIVQLVNDVTLFKHSMENPRFVEVLQSPLMAQQVQKHPPLSEYVEAQFQAPCMSQKGKEYTHAVESCEAPKENLSVHEHVVRTPVLQAVPDQPATLKRPNAGSNGQDIMFQDMHQVLPPSIAHFGYFEGGSVFQTMAGYALENQQYMPGTVFGGMQGMVPDPMYANIGMQGTQGQFGCHKATWVWLVFHPTSENDTWTSAC